MKNVFVAQNKHKLSSVSLYLIGLLQIWMLYQQYHFSMLWTVYILVLFSILYLVGIWGDAILNKPELSTHYWITWCALGFGLMVMPSLLGSATSGSVLASYFGQQGLLVAPITALLPYIFGVTSIAVIVVAAVVHFVTSFCYGFQQEILSRWLESVAVMAAILTSITSISVVNHWLCAGMLENAQLEHFFNLTVLALFSTAVYEFVLLQLNFMLDIHEKN